MPIILFFIALVFLMLLFVRWFEWSNIYFPDKAIVATPDSIELPYEDVYFLTQDNIKLNGWFVPNNKARGTMLLCHGNAGNISHRLEVISILHSLEFNVFIFDYRGYGRSRGFPTEKGTYLDTEAAYDYLLTRQDINKEELIVYGKSLGGAVAVDLALRAEVCAVIIDSAFTSVARMAQEIYFLPQVEHVLSIKYDTLSKIGKLSMPKLIIHSKEDEIVPFHHAMELFEEAKDPKKIYVMQGGHNEAIFMCEDEFKRELDDFLTNDCGL